MDNMSQQLRRLMIERNWQPTYQELVTKAFQDEDVQKFLEENSEKLSEENILRSAANIYEFVQEKQKVKENRAGIAPGFYPQLVINKNHIDVTYIPTEQTKQAMERREVKNRVQSYYMPKDITDISLSDVEVTGERSEVITQAYAFLERFLQKPKAYHKGMYVHGPFGTGKTFLMGALAYELAEQGYTSALIHFPTFAFEMKQSISDNTTAEKIEPIRRAPILIIDDIGADSMSSWIRDDVLGVILQFRMQEQLPTFFTSNFSMNELERHLTYTQRGEEEPLKAQRIMERVRFLSEEVEMTGRNRRHD